MDTAVAKAFVLMLFRMLESVETENEALRLALRLRGVRRTELRAQMDELRESQAVKRRLRATIAPTRKAIEHIFGEIESKENLAVLPVKANKLQ